MQSDFWPCLATTRPCTTPLALVVSVGLRGSVRYGPAGRPVSVEVAGHRQQGLIQTLGRTA